MPFFSKSKIAPRAELTHSFSPNVRNRLWANMERMFEGQFGGAHNFNDAISTAVKRIYEADGELAHLDGVSIQYQLANHPFACALTHFKNCDDDKVLDFLQAFFQSGPIGYLHEQNIQRINTVLREEGIGFELKPGVIHFGEILPPAVIVLTSQLMHQEVVAPALKILSGAKFKVANDEMLRAFERYRKGDLPGAFTLCAAAYESTLKTICDAKGWQYDANKDTINSLVDACNANGLFEPFYSDVLARLNMEPLHARGYGRSK